ncbi:GGDEF domain-containing protein [Fuchsiella alkaliacetigena]|uniref:GGDEF domain-containing protein n=1 Tax=Fuchsiella alkaliacetigena TaxID=957042 RepID=UPI00200B5E89|nr:GGDEF domain-containing protein [Fuchsiella alkaliacetigena]MCK8824047.1 GGDEF domain-containing protein [Fuchsiella alkaliacetigena]
MKDFFERFKYIIIVVLFLSIVFISYTNYRSTKEVIKDKYSHRQQLVEKSILQTINHINDSYKIAEQQLNQEMKEYSQVMRDKYKRNPEVMDWDLEKLKEKFGDYDIYIVDSDLKIIKTTYQKDLGLDFSKYTGFAQVLRERLEGDSFVVDRLDLSTKEGEIKKYSYLPTHDNKYILELSIEVQKRFPVLQNLDIFGDATELTEEYEMVEEISFFSVEPIEKGVAKLRSSKGLDPDVPEPKEELVRRSVLSNEVQSTVIQSEGTNYIHKFFPALVSGDDDQQQWNSYVVGITYNDQVMWDEINEHRRLFLINALIMIAVFVIFIIMTTYLLREFEQLAYQDQLTGLANRKSFAGKFDKLIKTAQKKREKLAILFLDVDKFKEINDNFGHGTGDKILKEIANRLKSSLRKQDIVSRLGGDEFTIAVSGINSQEGAIKVADRVMEEFREPLTVGESKFFISISVGISIYPDDGRELEELIKKADYAMYKAKKEQQDYILYNGSGE